MDPAGAVEHDEDDVGRGAAPTGTAEPHGKGRVPGLATREATAQRAPLPPQCAPMPVGQRHWCSAPPSDEEREGDDQRVNEVVSGCQGNTGATTGL